MKMKRVDQISTSGLPCLPSESESFFFSDKDWSGLDGLFFVQDFGEQVCEEACGSSR